MIKAFAFDLDGTLTQHKTPLNETNRAILDTLSKKYKLVIIGAGGCARIHAQMGGYPTDVIGNYGMQYAQYRDGSFVILRDSTVPVQDRASVEERITALRERYGYTGYKGDNTEYHASGCLTFPLLGTRAEQSDKLAFDPDRKKRRAIYRDVCDTVDEYNVFVGGSSSFDMAPKPYDKYYALRLWCEENGIRTDEVIFVGDDYGTGGNDESVYRSDVRFVTVDDYTRLGEVLLPWLDESAVDIDSLLGVRDTCECGMTHSCNIRRVIIRDGAINELAAMVSDKHNILLVSDRNTYRVAGERILSLIGDRAEHSLVYDCDGFLVPNEEAVARLDGCVTDRTELIIGVGSGVINDLCKYVSHAHGLPYYIVATAPSMDGYASKGAAMLFDGMKITTNADVPQAIIADTEILRNAPIEMLRAGYGDIIGKYSCLNDWRLSHTVNGESLCEYVYKLTRDTVDSVAGIGEAIAARDEKAIAALMRALVTVGVAMAYMGNSRPASGSEHHLSHYFEVTGLLRAEPYFCHGTDVAYSTYVTALLREKLIKQQTPEWKPINTEEWEREIRRVYRGKDSVTADGIIAMQKRLGLVYRDRRELYREKWDDIRQVLADSPTPDEVLSMLGSVGLSLDEFHAMYSEEKLRDGVKYAMYLKDRETVLWYL